MTVRMYMPEYCFLVPGKGHSTGIKEDHCSMDRLSFLNNYTYV